MHGETVKLVGPCWCTYLSGVLLPNSATHTHQQGHYKYMQPHHHRFNYTPMYHN